MQFFHLDSSITSNCNKKKPILLASITFWQIIIKLFLRSSTQWLRRITLNNGANILTQLACYFSIKRYTIVIPSSMGNISYTEIMQLFFSGNTCNFPHEVCTLCIFFRWMKTSDNFL